MRKGAVIVGLIAWLTSSGLCVAVAQSPEEIFQGSLANEDKISIGYDDAQTAGRGPDTSLPETPTRPDQPRSFVEGHNDFAIALYGELLGSSGNLFLSPISIRTVLAMTYAGARGETATEMRRALRFASSEESLHADFGEIIRRLNAGGGGKYEMVLANSLWVRKGAPLQTGFADLVTRHYGAGTNIVDFGNDAARVTINEWVEGKTKQKVRELIPRSALSSDTRLVLVNAVYFKGMWMLQFRKADTLDEPFYLEDDGKVQVPLMHQQEKVRYLQEGGYQAVDLDYQGGDLSMLVLLPDKKDGLRDLEMRLSAPMLHDCVARMVVREVKLSLPRFKMTWGTAPLGDNLRALGMRLPFSPQANFAGISGHESSPLWISEVFHKAFVEVNEEGTEAAAATGVITTDALEPQEPPVPVFRADHPFVFAIRDQKTGAILFLGRIANPTQES